MSALDARREERLMELLSLQHKKDRMVQENLLDQVVTQIQEVLCLDDGDDSWWTAVERRMFCMRLGQTGLLPTGLMRRILSSKGRNDKQLLIRWFLMHLLERTVSSSDGDTPNWVRKVSRGTPVKNFGLSGPVFDSPASADSPIADLPVEAVPTQCVPGPSLVHSHLIWPWKETWAKHQVPCSGKMPRCRTNLRFPLHVMS